MNSTEPSHGQRALVVFIDLADCRWLRGLRSGFRHCFAAIQDGSSWIACDPLKDRMEVCLLQLPGSFDLSAFYAEQGHTVLVGEIDRSRRPRQVVPSVLTCVGVVQRLVGVHAPWALTPWQLYRHLRRAGWLTLEEHTRDALAAKFGVDRPE